MNDDSFASYILSEKDWGKKLEIMYYLQKKTGINYDNAVIFKTLLTKLFLDFLQENYPNIEVDPNVVITARLLCDCMKDITSSADLEEKKNYAVRGAKYIATLGFDQDFCRICEGVNRYSIQEDRPLESDLIELTDQFGGMLLDRPERIGFKPDEALVLLQFRNLKDKENKLLEQFAEFVKYMESIQV